MRRYERILVEILVFERGVCHFERKFQGGRGSSTNDFWRQKIESLGYHVALFA